MDIKYPPLTADTEGNDCFSICQTNRIKCPQKLTQKTAKSLSQVHSRGECATVQEMSHDTLDDQQENSK